MGRLRSVARAGKDGEAEESCTAAIYRADGKVVYRATGFSVLFLSEFPLLSFRLWLEAMAFGEAASKDVRKRSEGVLRHQS